MVLRLRRKFVLTAMTSLLIVLVLLIGGINLLNFVQTDRRIDEKLRTLMANDGTFPIPDDPKDFGKGDLQGAPGAILPKDNASSLFPKPDSMDRNRRAEAPFETRYFSVTFHEDGTVADTEVSHIASVTASEAQEVAISVASADAGSASGTSVSTAGGTSPEASSGSSSGTDSSIFSDTFRSGRCAYAGSYKYLTGTDSSGRPLIVFIECSSMLGNVRQLLVITLGIGAAALAGMFVLVILFSGKAVAPVVESLEKQKRFISDAGHELKTPLSVISANVDVLEMTGEKNDWTRSIRNQVKRMTDLVNNLLTLSRMEETGIVHVFEDQDLSAIVTDAASTYETVAVSLGKQLSLSITPGLHVKGEARSLSQLVLLLLDNAMKYSSEGGTVSLRLEPETGARNRQIRLEVSNPCDTIPDGNLDRLFDRFYRADESRSRKTGGYGIGLSAARAILEAHGGTIAAVRDGDRLIRFIARFPASSAAAERVSSRKELP